MNPSQITMCEQLGRYIASQSELTFVEPQSSEKGDIYATQLPPKHLRKTPAMSITDDPSTGQEPFAITQRITMTLHAEAISNEAAVSLLTEAKEILFPNGRFALPSPHADVPGVIGLPLEPGIHSVWRIIEMTPLTYPEVITPRSPSGQSVAEMTIEIFAVAQTVSVSE